MALADLNLNSITLEEEGTKHTAEVIRLVVCPGTGKLCQLIRQSEEPGGSLAFSLSSLSLAQLPALD